METLFFTIYLVFGIFAGVSILVFLSALVDGVNFYDCHWWLWGFLISAGIIVGTIEYSRNLAKPIKTEYRIPTKEIKKVIYTTTDDWGDMITKSYYSWEGINNLLVDDNILKSYDTLSVVKTEVNGQIKYTVFLSSSTVKDTTTEKSNQMLK